MGTLHVSYLPLSQHDTLPSSSCSTVVLFCVVVDSLCSDACECFIACHAHDAVPLVNAAQGSLCLCCARRLLASFLSDVVTC